MKKLIYITLALMGALSGPAALGDDDPIYELNSVMTLLNKVEDTVARPGLDLYQACDREFGGKSEQEKRSCIEKYSKVAGKHQLDIKIFGGYLDGSPSNSVDDLYERVAFMEKLSEPCRPRSAARTCGFRRDDDDASLLIRDLPQPGGGTLRVKIRFEYASVSTDDRRNRGSEEQRQRSEDVERSFISGLKTADVVFYSGHSRNGGGPDFRPPRRLKNNHVDYGWYQHNRPGLKMMVDALNQRPDKMALLGMFSCDSKRHFSPALSKTNVAGTMLTRRTISFNESYEIMLKALNGLIGLSCDRDLGVSPKEAVTTGFGGTLSTP